MKPKPSAQQAGAEGDAGAIGAASQSPVDTANPQQSQDLVNNSSQQQHQMVSELWRSALTLNTQIDFPSILAFGKQQQRENRPCQQQVQKIASESMIPTYRSGTDSMHKSNPSGTNSKQQQQQQNNSSSFSANAPKADGKNAVNNESNQNKNQCNSPVKRRSISQIDVRHFLIIYLVGLSLLSCCRFKIQITFISDNNISSKSTHTHTHKHIVWFPCFCFISVV